MMGSETIFLHGMVVRVNHGVTGSIYAYAACLLPVLLHAKEQNDARTHVDVSQTSKC
jgi:hypothetical protein